METYKKIFEVLENTKPDLEKALLKGNKTAGIRVRKELQEIKILVQNLRQEITKATKKNQ
jgi:hypothetical protein